MYGIEKESEMKDNTLLRHERTDDGLQRLPAVQEGPEEKNLCYMD